MNILLINHYAGSPELGMEFRPYYMAKEWVKMGAPGFNCRRKFLAFKKSTTSGRGRFDRWDSISLGEVEYL